MPLTRLGSLVSGTVGGGTFNINVNLQQNTSPGKRESTSESGKKWNIVMHLSSASPRGGEPRAGVGTLRIVHFKVLVFPHPCDESLQE